MIPTSYFFVVYHIFHIISASSPTSKFSILVVVIPCSEVPPPYIPPTVSPFLAPKNQGQDSTEAVDRFKFILLEIWLIFLPGSFADMEKVSWEGEIRWLGGGGSGAGGMVFTLY